ncbi:Nramp family divalent metal transporter [Candidatus Protochlamydia phocaeensis]|uniref:Nramp family divalent metal transporter n=1 Tax=Candidatus Protochlamydia phocaeensis TaxID=1414722 RepID=UPI0008386B29|nr:Nramp family divalent metal transporter [Candidatus Protochlamydia phocaeensis]
MNEIKADSIDHELKDLNRTPSLREVYQTISVSKEWPWWRKMLAFAGPGYLISVGYMDPGNWATDLAGGSRFGYALLSVIFLSNLMAMLLQHLSAKLGVVTGRDLAQACRDHYSAPINYVLWVLSEIAICACDLAELIGSAIALKLLFGIPMLGGVCLTALDVLIIMSLQNKGFRYLEAFILALILIIAVCFGLEIFFSQPDFTAIAKGFIPHSDILLNSEMLYVAIGILGATVMPHNLYLHSSIVQTRKYDQTHIGKRETIKFVTIDSTVALSFALFINASILIIAAAVFHKAGHHELADIQEAYQLLTPLLNAPLASTIFALALLAAGQNSTLTGTLAGQIVMEGFLNIRMRPWLRRLLTRMLALIPAIAALAIYGEQSATQLLIISQVVLSLQLSFAIIPLVLFTSDRSKMGLFANSWWIQALAWSTTALIIFLNGKYLLDFLFSLL